MNFEISRISNDYQNVKRQINCGENYSTSTRLNLKFRFVGEKKKCVKNK